jgi:hypothetical protein
VSSGAVSTGVVCGTASNSSESSSPHALTPTASAAIDRSAMGQRAARMSIRRSDPSGGRSWDSR